MITDKELDKRHNENCLIIARALASIDYVNCVDWSKVRIKIDDSNVYKNKVVKK